MPPQETKPAVAAKRESGFYVKPKGSNDQPIHVDCETFEDAIRVFNSTTKKSLARKQLDIEEVK